MSKAVKISVIFIVVLLGFVSCRNGKAAQEALQVVKKYSGKMFKSAEKENFYIRYSDDVVRNIEFVKVTCTSCDGAQIDEWDNICEECDGQGYVYKIRTKK